jgi:CO/xanthine dehydrogenase FAD-binding subunit
LVGYKPTAAVMAEAAEWAAHHEIEPFGNVHASVDYQRNLAKVLTRRALVIAVERAGIIIES